MSAAVRFVGYFPSGERSLLPQRNASFQPEFIVTGSTKLPDGAQVSADTLLRLGIKREPFSIPSYWEWTRERFVRMLAIRRMLREVKP